MKSVVSSIWTQAWARSPRARGLSRAHRRARSRRFLLLVAATGITSLVLRQSYGQISGQTSAHDPSEMVKVGTKYFYFATGQGIVSRSSSNEAFWSAGPSVFSQQPAWTSTAVPGFTGNFWA